MEQESIGKYGEGVKPLSVRRDVGVRERIDVFIKKLKEIDKQHSPKPEWLEGSEEQAKKYKAGYSAWMVKLRDLVKTERRYLAAEGTAEGGKKARIRATTFRVRMSMYRRYIIEEFDYVNPRFYARANDLMASKLFSESAIARIRHLSKQTSYQKLMKLMRDTLVKDVGKLSDAEYAAIKDLRSYAHHPVLPLLNISDRLSSMIKQKGAEAQTARHTKALRKICINYYLAWMERILKDHASHDWQNIAIALVLATGRRPIELFVTGKFSEPEKKGFLFSGQAKTKMSESVPYRIPVLYDVETIQLAMKRMRRLLKVPKDATHDDVNKMTAKALSLRMKGVFAEKSVVVYTLRAAYARVCVQRYYSPKYGSEEDFLASILGHNENDFATVQHYKTVIFVEETTMEEAAKEWELIAKQEAEEESGGFITKEMIERVESFRDKFKRGQARVLEFIIDELKRGNCGLTQSYIKREGGFFMDAIKAVLAEIGEIAPSTAHESGRRKEYRRA
jgi:hypothetical protein